MSWVHAFPTVLALWLLLIAALAGALTSALNWRSEPPWARRRYAVLLWAFLSVAVAVGGLLLCA